jgi:3',5'-cyclic AMP phosphodiesterase CpdA
MGRVTVISDTHLSPRRAYNVANFRAAVEHVNADPPDFVVHAGDVSYDAVDDAEERAFARESHRDLAAPLVVIPGNHDLGDNGVEPWKGEAPTEARRAAWLAEWGADRFAVDLAGWRLIGIDNLLVGTGLASEAEQERWLGEQLAGAADVALFMHKPLYTEAIDDGATKMALERPARRRLLELLAGSAVRLVVSGHVHRYRTGRLYDGVDFVWAPSATQSARDRGDGTDRSPGVIELTFTPGRYEHRRVRPAGTVDNDLSGLLDRYGSPRFYPERPVAR